MNARKPLFAGSWYPAGRSACEQEIKGFLAEGKAWPVPERSYEGGIVPHAGWYFSGAIACNVIYHLVETPAPDVLFIFGMHLPVGAPNYIMNQGRWATPFGDIPIQEEIADTLIKEFSFTVETEKKFNPDNTIELQLPFVKYFFKDTAIVPIGVCPDPAVLEIGKRAVEIARALGLKAKVIGSTDLTHYGINYGFMPKGIGQQAVNWVRNENDQKVIKAMLARDPERVLHVALSHNNACCAGAAATAIAAANALGHLPATLLTYSTSYDKSPGDSLVGYVGILF
jgi:MEMO1 family protein